MNMNEEEIPKCICEITKEDVTGSQPEFSIIGKGSIDNELHA